MEEMPRRIRVQLIFQDEISGGTFGGISENLSKKVILKQPIISQCD